MAVVSSSPSVCEVTQRATAVDQGASPAGDLHRPIFINLPPQPCGEGVPPMLVLFWQTRPLQGPVLL